MKRIAAAAVALSLVTSPAWAAPDGQQLFNARCKSCHAGGKIAPTLNGVAGGKIAAKAFNYSPALKSRGGTWTDANLDAFLTAPGTFAPGTKMFMSVPSKADRTALIAFLKTLK